MTDVIGGTGRSIWDGRRMTVTDGMGTTLGAEVITAQLTYGPLGACQGGTLMVSRPPDAWLTSARSRLLQSSIDGDQVHIGLLDQATRKPGSLAQINLLAPHLVYADIPGQGVTYPGVSAGVRQYDVALPAVPPHETLMAVMNRHLEPFVNSEFGVGADGVALLGVPEALGDTVPALLSVDSRVISVESLGLVIPPYVTHAVFDLGDDWQRYVYARPDVPPFVLRKTGVATANPQTALQIVNPEWEYVLVNANMVFGPGQSRSTIGAPETRTFEDPLRVGQPASIDVGRYRLVLPGDSLTSKNRKLTVICGFTLLSSEPVDAALPTREPTFTLRMSLGSLPGGASTQALTPSLTGLILSVRFDVSGDDLRGGPQLNLDYVLDMSGTNRRITLEVQSIVTILETEVPNLGGVVMPDGWTAPFQVGPRYRLSVPGVHIPPLLISGLPGGVTQYAAGTTVDWSRGEAKTTIETAALPYPGQRRGG